MASLRELQVAFRRHLMWGDPAVAAYISATSRPSSGERLAVYASAYRTRLAEALATDYEALKAVMGEEGFLDLCRDYVDAHPPTSYSLRWLGQHLPAFLQETHAREAYLAELAGFEWTLAAAFDAANAPTAGVEEAGRVPTEAWPSLRLRLHPSVYRLRLVWNTLQLWQAVKGGGPIPAPEHLPAALPCLIWREGLTTRYRSLEVDEEAAIACAASGGTFSEICEGLASFGGAEDATALRAASLLKGWLSSGLVTELIPWMGASGS
jgi:hypothetical protein